jgi:gamma-glutamylcyclotransferase (GGCT)/AIG2-like uncharacterized protein YtfP
MALPERSTLARVLAHVNDARRAPPEARRASLAAALILLGDTPGRATHEQLADRVDQALGRPSQRLAAYGSLRRGERNHGEVADLGGRWLAGHVRGRFETASARTGGWPALAPDARGAPFAVEVLESPALPGAWPRLDDFEGEPYRRELVAVELERGATCVANLYVPALSG